jgi:hypothetical protein
MTTFYPNSALPEQACGLMVFPEPENIIDYYLAAIKRLREDRDALLAAAKGVVTSVDGISLELADKIRILAAAIAQAEEQKP